MRRSVLEQFLPADTLDPVQQFAETSREPQLESVQSLFSNDRNMSIRRSEIEKALDKLISNFEGIRFQRLAVVLAKQLFTDFVASDPMKDLGADAVSSGQVLCEYSPTRLNCHRTGKWLPGVGLDRRRRHSARVLA